MNPVKPKDLIKVLENLGFRHTRTKGSHYRFVHPDGRKTTVPVHSGKEVGAGLMLKILSDVKITHEEFEKLIHFI